VSAPPPPPPPAPPPTARIGLLGAADLLLVVIAVLAGVRLLAPLVGGAPGTPLLPGAAGPGALLPVALSIVLQAVLTLAALYLVVIRLRGLAWSDLGLVTPPEGWLMRGLLLALVTVPAVGLVNLLVSALQGAPIENPQIETLAPVGLSLGNFLLLLLLAGLLVPLAEELAFRGLLQGWLRERYGPGAGILLSALIFAAVHGIPMLMPALLLVGLLLGWLYERSGSLWPAVAMHGAFNAIMTTLLYLYLTQGVLTGEPGL